MQRRSNYSDDLESTLLETVGYLNLNQLVSRFEVQAGLDGAGHECVFVKKDDVLLWSWDRFSHGPIDGHAVYTLLAAILPYSGENLAVI